MTSIRPDSRHRHDVNFVPAPAPASIYTPTTNEQLLHKFYVCNLIGNHAHKFTHACIYKLCISGITPSLEYMAMLVRPGGGAEVACADVMRCVRCAVTYAVSYTRRCCWCCRPAACARAPDAALAYAAATPCSCHGNQRC